VSAIVIQIWDRFLDFFAFFFPRFGVDVVLRCVAGSQFLLGVNSELIPNTN
jgi:hypothetical protein